MKQVNFLFVFAIIVVILALLNIVITIEKINRVRLTGYATGTANLTIESTAEINFTTSNINWGSGKVTTGQTSATLNTGGGANNVTNGNWTGNTVGLILENIGNVNVSLKLAAGKTNETFIGGAGSDYEWNITNSDPNSCTNASGVDLGNSWDVNGSAMICSVFAYESGKDAVRIDIKLVIPEDSTKGALGDTITATATA